MKSFEQFSWLPEEIQHDIFDYHTLLDRRLINRSERDQSLLEFLKHQKIPSGDEIKSYSESIPPNIVIMSNFSDEHVDGIEMYEFTTDSHCDLNAIDPIIFYGDKSEVEYDMYSYNNIAQEDIIDVDIRTWYYTLKNRISDVDVNYNIMKEVIYYIFSRTYNKLLSIDTSALFAYYYFMYKTLNLSFKKYYHLYSSKSVISHALIEEMTDRFILGIDRMIDMYEI